jgi:hypothetical protein
MSNRVKSSRVKKTVERYGCSPIETKVSYARQRTTTARTTNSRPLVAWRTFRDTTEFMQVWQPTCYLRLGDLSNKIHPVLRKENFSIVKDDDDDDIMTDDTMPDFDSAADFNKKADVDAMTDVDYRVLEPSLRLASLFLTCERVKPLLRTLLFHSDLQPLGDYDEHQKQMMAYAAQECQDLPVSTDVARQIDDALEELAYCVEFRPNDDASDDDDDPF